MVLSQADRPLLASRFSYPSLLKSDLSQNVFCVTMVSRIDGIVNHLTSAQHKAITTAKVQL